MMWKMLLPILIIVLSNTGYQLCCKGTPEDLNTFASLTLTYAVGAVCSLILFFVTGKDKSFFHEMSKVNWSTIVLGLVIVGLEVGCILMYRAGWKISLGNLVASITLSCVLLIVGMVFFKESVTIKQLAGMGICIAGLILITG